jgi:hypothetical protein
MGDEPKFALMMQQMPKELTKSPIMNNMYLLTNSFIFIQT